MYYFFNIFNLEKKKIFSKIEIKNFIKNLEITIKGSGCSGLKFFFKNLNKFFKKNEIIINIKNLKLLINQYIYQIILNIKIIKKKGKLLIKNKLIKEFCNCGKSFKLKI